MAQIFTGWIDDIFRKYLSNCTSALQIKSYLFIPCTIHRAGHKIIAHSWYWNIFGWISLYELSSGNKAHRTAKGAFLSNYNCCCEFTFPVISLEWITKCWIHYDKWYLIDWKCISIYLIWLQQYEYEMTSLGLIKYFVINLYIFCYAHVQ